MEGYKTKAKQFSGTRYADIGRKAYHFYNQIKRKSKRKPYVRSEYFSKEKVFLELFWKHLQDKHNLNDKTRRLKYFPCAIELIQKTRVNPKIMENPGESHDILYRFMGIAPNGMKFIVQVKENKRNKKKWLMSIFPTVK